MYCALAVAGHWGYPVTPVSSVVDELITSRAPRSLASDLCQRVLQHHLHLTVARNSGVAHVEHQIVAGVQHEGSRHRNVSRSRRRAPVRRHKSFQDDAVENILQKVAVVTHVEVVGVVNVGGPEIRTLRRLKAGPRIPLVELRTSSRRNRRPTQYFGESRIRRQRSDHERHVNVDCAHHHVAGHFKINVRTVVV